MKRLQQIKEQMDESTNKYANLANTDRDIRSGSSIAHPSDFIPLDLRWLISRVENLEAALRKSSEHLDTLTYKSCYMSEYTFDDSEFGIICYVRDICDQALMDDK